MLLSPDIFVVDPLNRPYADLLFVQPFARFLHQIDTE